MLFLSVLKIDTWWCSGEQAPVPLIKKSVVENKVDLVDHGRVTRHDDGLKIKLPIPRNQFVRHAPFYIGCTLWNNLPGHVRNLELNQFKVETKKLVKDGTIRPNIV